MPKCPFCEKVIAHGTEMCPHCHAPLTPSDPSGGQDLEKRIQALLERDRKIDAIKLYREETSAGLAESKEAVEGLMAGQRLPKREGITDAEVEAEALGLVQRALNLVQEKAEWEGDVLRLLGEGKKIQAIKVYRERMGGGLKEAKEAVEALGKQHGIVGGGGCLGIVLTFIVIVGASWWLA